MKRILTNSIHPPKLRIFHAADAGGGAGAGVIEKPAGETTATEGAAGDGKLGSAFSKMVRDMTTDDAGGDAGSTQQQPPAKKEGKDDAGNGGAPTDDKKPKDNKTGDDAKKKRTPGDALLGALNPDKDTKDGAAKEKTGGDTTNEPKVKTAEELEAEIAADTKGMSAGSAANFRKLAQAKHAVEVEADRLRKELNAAKAAKPELPPEVKAQLTELERLREEHRNAQETLEKIGAERSPQYQNKFVNGRNSLVERAKKLVQSRGGDGAAFADAMAKLQGRERSVAIQAAVENLEQIDVQSVASLVAQVDDLDEQAKDFLANSRTELERQERDQQAAEQEEINKNLAARRQRFNEVFNGMLKMYPDDHPMAAEANPIVKEALEKAQSFLFETTTFDKFAEASIAYALYPTLQKNLAAAASRIIELEAQLEEIEAAGPSVGSGGGGSGGQEQPKGFADRFKGEMNKGGTP